MKSVFSFDKPEKIPIFAPEFAVPYDNIQTIDYQQDFIKLLIKNNKQHEEKSIY